MAPARKRLFHTASDADIKAGEVSDVYFQRTVEILVARGDRKRVKAEVLVFVDGVALAEARNLLWRRETRNEGSARKYRASGQPNAVIVRDLRGVCGLEHVLYTDFNPERTIATPDPASLADAAIRSVGRAALGKDGISYLIGLLEAGIETALTPLNVAEILSRTGASDLAGALRHLRTAQQEAIRNGQS